MLNVNVNFSREVSQSSGLTAFIHAVDSTIAAGNTVNLAADNDITLEARGGSRSWLAGQSGSGHSR
ncbi:MAG: hypothetical protein EOP24_34965 [Hyphomicrobiales bacterium]|nr:MAG: hypothetical protein EOP24_34965 [Hyphomicrobiales bacterium]